MTQQNLLELTTQGNTSNFGNTYHEVLETAKVMKLSFGSVELLKRQITKINAALTKLSDTKTNLEPVIGKIGDAVAKVDAIRATKAVVGIGLQLLGQKLSDDDDLLAILGSEISFEIGSELLAQAIHTENQLRETHKALINLNQLLDNLIQQGTQLTQVAECCIQSSVVLEYLGQNQSLLNFDCLEDQFNQLASQVKFNFCFSKPELTLKQMNQVITAQAHIKETKLKIDRLTQALTQETKYSIRFSTIEALIYLFKASLLGIEFNDQGQVVLLFPQQQQTVETMCYHCNNLQGKLNNLASAASYLIDLVKQCANDSTFTKVLNNTEYSINFDELRQKIKYLTDRMETILVFKKASLLQKVEEIKKYQLKLRGIETKLELDIITRTNFNKENFNLNISAIKIILNLFGRYVVGLGSNHNGEIVLCYVNHQEDIRKTIRYCIELKEEIKKPIVQGGYLISLGEQCLKHPRLLQIFEEVKKSEDWSELKARIKEIDKSININLAFHNINKMREQVEILKTAKNSLYRIDSNLRKVIQTVDKSNTSYITSDTVEALLLLAGSISGVEFDDTRSLVINYANRKEKVKDTLQTCTTLKSKTAALIQQANKLIEISERCFKDSDFRKKLRKQNDQKKLKIKFLATTSILVLLSPLAWICLVRFEQEKVLAGSQTLLVNVKDASDAQNINALRASEIQLKAAIATLRTIQNRPVSHYQQAQTEIASLVSRLEAIQNRLKVENEVLVTLESARQLATEAAKISKMNDTTFSWQIASTKWQQAIDLLEAVPKNTFVAAQVSSNYTAISKNLSMEQKAVNRLENAQKMRAEATEMSQEVFPTDETWQQAKLKCQTAIRLLTAIPKNTSVYIKAQEMLPNYQNTCTDINNIN